MAAKTVPVAERDDEVDRLREAPPTIEQLLFEIITLMRAISDACHSGVGHEEDLQSTQDRIETLAGIAEKRAVGALRAILETS